LPAFQPGDKIKLDLTNDNKSIGVGNDESTKIVGGKVKIEL